MPRRSLLVRLAVYGTLGAAVLVWTMFQAFAGSKNGFNLDNSAVPESEILQGGPPRDGIPAIDDPQFLAAAEADFLRPEDRILGIARNGIAKAYPIRILNWHEIVNDHFGDEAIVVTYCPLCGTGMAFEADVAGQPRSFGVSGLLYNSDVLLYDRGTDSLWSQIAQTAISGPLKGAELELVPTAHTSWADWRQRHPDTRVLSTDTGHRRDYGRDPYAGYADSAAVMFPAGNLDRRYHPKALVIGLTLDGTAKAYPFEELAAADTPLRDRLAGRELRVEFDPVHRTGRILDAEGEEIPTVIAYWFAWTAFHPDTDVFTAG